MQRIAIGTGARRIEDFSKEELDVLLERGRALQARSIREILAPLLTWLRPRGGVQRADEMAHACRATSA